TEITDDFMRQMISRTKNFSVAILKAGPNRNKPGTEKIIWVHGRRNFNLSAQGLLPIICLVSDGSDLSGVGIFNANIDEAKSIMDEDQAAKKGIFICEIHACQSFPGRLFAGAKDHGFRGLKG
ncbi:MAG: hypothetical protein JW999_06475, partial [Methanotrichaceae archaeon]|nr:hypothetical protein [Methanotrichaceae archaeon]